MKLYLDMCVLKRPFDDQSDSRIAVETQAVIMLMGWFDAGICAIANSEALILENAHNRNLTRRERVAEMLHMFGKPESISSKTISRSIALRTRGFHDMDALHIACAEHAGADVFVTCDDALIACAAKWQARLDMPVKNPIDLMRERKQ